MAVMDDIDELLRDKRKPKVWDVLHPNDVTLYDIIYEPYLDMPRRKFGPGNKQHRT